MGTKLFYLLLILGLLFFSCDNSERNSGPTLINTWKEIEPVGILQYTGDTYQKLIIHDDSTFQLKYQSWGDLFFPGDPCNYVINYFIKGICSTASDVITFTGCYTDSTYTICLPNCGGDLDYKAHYEYKIIVDSLILNPGSSWTRRRDMIYN